MRSEAGKTPRPTARTANSAKVSVTQNPFRLTNQVLHLGKNVVLQFRVIDNPGIDRPHATDGSIECWKSSSAILAEIDAVTPGDTIFMRDDNAAGFLHRGPDRRPVIRRERPQVDHLDAGAGMP